MTTQAQFWALDRGRFETREFFKRPPRSTWKVDEARAFFAAAMQTCAITSWSATRSGSIRRILDDAPPSLYRPPFADAWGGLRQTLGVETSAHPPTWWLRVAYDHDWCLGQTSPASLARLKSDLAASNFLHDGVAILRGGATREYVDDLVSLCAFLMESSDRWIIGLEAGS